MAEGLLSAVVAKPQRWCPGTSFSAVPWEWEQLVGGRWLRIRVGRMHAARVGLRLEEETVWETLSGSRL